jgi:predicted alpha/beta hydrolase
MKKITIEARDGYPLSALFGEPLKTPSGTIVIRAATGVKKEVHKFTRHRVGHVGIFRKRFELVLWSLHTIHGSGD